MTDQIVVAFDAYGTLLSTASISKQLAEHFTQEQAETVAAAWRKYQLEYTWRLNSMSPPATSPLAPAVLTHARPIPAL